MPKVSVIIPVYNVEKYLRQCLDSVVNQTLKDIEIICVNDGSTDNSLEILEEYASKDSRIKIITQENKGLAPARNTGIENTKGEYIFFLDSDDYLTKIEIIENLYQKALQTNADVIFSKSKVVTEGNDLRISNKSQSMDNWLNVDIPEILQITFDNFKKYINYIPCVAWGKLYKSNFIKLNNIKFIDNHSLFEDNGFWIKILACLPLIAELYEDSICYRLRADSISNLINNIRIKYDNLKAVIEDAVDFIMENSYIQYKDFMINEVKKSKYAYVFDEKNKNLYVEKNIINEIKTIQNYTNNKLVSIVLPVYNGQKYIRQSIDSILLQTYHNIELIIVNDCSTDDTLAIISKYAEKDKRIKIINNETNQKLPKSLNIGFKNASGEYYTWTSDDNIYKPNAIETMVKYLEYLQGYSMVSAICDIIDKDGNIIKNSKEWWPNRNIKDLANTNNILACFMYRKKIAELIGVYDENTFGAEDYDYWYRIALNGKILYIDENLYQYRFHPNSLTNTQKSINDSVAQQIRLKYFIPLYKKLGYTTPQICDMALKKYKKTKNRGYLNLVKKIKFSYYLSYIFSNNMQKIFSITNEDIRKVVTIFGIKLKFKSKKLIERKKFNNIVNKLNKLNKALSKQNSYIQNMLGKKDNEILKLHYQRQALSEKYNKKINNLINIINRHDEKINDLTDIINKHNEKFSIQEAHNNYKSVIEKIKNKKGKIRVLFLVSEISKWKAQTLYDLMEKDDKFEPFIALTILSCVQNGADTTRNHLEEDYNYFKNKNMNVVYAYKDNEYIDLKTFDPNIIFYQQPWEIDNIQFPDKISTYAIPYYIPYYVNNYSILPIDYNQLFHKYLYKHYVLNKQWENEYNKLSNINNFYGIGHTILDYFYLNKDKKSKKNYVIYAPHYSFSHIKNSNPLNIGTFLNNGFQIQEYAKVHSEFNWVFKPHPGLKYALTRIGISAEDIKKYWDEWARIGTVCEDSSYMDLFLDSKALITDCGSFLTEYFCTGKPLIHLISSDCKIQPNEIAKKNFDTFYKVHNLDEMFKTFDKVLIQNIDDKKEERLKVLEETGLLNNYAAKNILEDIKKTFNL